MTALHRRVCVAVACFLASTSAFALPKPPHDYASDVSCADCHVPYGGLTGSPYEGVTTGGSTTTLVRTGASWTANQWANAVVSLVGGPNAGQFRTVTSNTATQLSWASPLPFALTAGVTFRIGISTQADIETQCKTCHNPSGMASTFSNVGMHTLPSGQVIGCGKCHEPHNSEPNSGQGNKLIRDTLRWSSASGSVAYPSGGANPSIVGQSPYNGICEVCHTATSYHRNSGGGLAHNNGLACGSCHNHGRQFGPMGGGAHGTHVTALSGPQAVCSDCHASISPLRFVDDTTSLQAATFCADCHSADGLALARQYWNAPGSAEGTTGSWVVVEGETSYCGSCHDATPGATRAGGSGDDAPNVLGNESSYGYFVTGHGKPLGNYARQSWQDSAATGNPAANQALCSTCHGLALAHFNNPAKRLKPGYQDDANNSNCRQCHSSAGNNPQWYTTMAAFSSSAHQTTRCSRCHDVHGAAAAAATPAMTRASKQVLCYQCHTDGVVTNNAISGAGLANDIQQAFAMSVKHDLGASFSVGASAYTVECVACHNVHLVTGKYSQADQGKSPVTRFSSPLQVWGDDAGEKIAQYASTGTYRTPNGDAFDGTVLPDYVSFCQDCHGQGSGHSSFNLDWNGDPHGKQSANMPNGYGTCPNWFACGKAAGWDSDDCIGSQASCWPVISQGAGDQIWSRAPYTHTQRVAGANFTLSCTDCHEAHGSGTGSMLRSNPNGGTGTSNWNTMCNNCHYYYSDWHAGMACGSASCHITNSIHRMSNKTGAGGTRMSDPTLVLDYRFENNLKDSGNGQMDGKWFSTAGSYSTGKSGNAAVLGEDIGVQIGTETATWSTDEGYHGTWKLTEMKFSTTLEAWVYPADSAKSEYTILNKHVGVNSNGGYVFSLKKFAGTLRAAFNMAADNNGFSQDGRAGVRGAYSSVAVPLSLWTHVAATFDTSGADRTSDPSVGRIRIYVNGEDVTTSDASGNSTQPGAGETSIFAHSENSPWNEAICYDGSWCASEAAIGGFDWESTNFIGRIDEVKVWNITKDAAYFAPIDTQAGPYISHVEGLLGSTALQITFSEGVYASTGGSGNLGTSDFVLTDVGGNNSRGISGLTHVAAARTATAIMSQPLAVADIGVDTLATASTSVFDEFDNAAPTSTVTIGLASTCSSSPVSLQLNEASGSTYIMDAQGVLYGAVNGGASTLTGSAYSGGGDGSGRYLMFAFNDTCLQASTAMTIETRIKPAGMAGTANYIRRILARDGSGNYQLSVWRNNTAYPGQYTAPSGEASIALWINPVDAHGGAAWKPVLTNYTGAATGSENNCPIVSDHWYLVRAVWNTNKSGGTPGQFFTPADIYIDDQGTTGSDDVSQNWTGYLNCTDADQSLKTDTVKFYTGDVIIRANSGFAVGTNRSTPTNNLFNGLIDWITWSDTAS